MIQPLGTPYGLCNPETREGLSGATQSRHPSVPQRPKMTALLVEAGRSKPAR
jgi:hypothetical protein